MNVAAGGTRHDLTATLVIAGVSSCLGRMTIGPLSDTTAMWGWTRPLLASLMLVGITASHVILAAGGGVVVALALSGFCSGALWSLLTPVSKAGAQARRQAGVPVNVPPPVGGDRGGDSL